MASSSIRVGGGEAFEALDQAVVHAQCRKFMIIQPGAHELPVLQREAERLDQMQLATGVGAQADDIAGIWRDFRLIENHMEHEKLPARLVSIGKNS